MTGFLALKQKASAAIYARLGADATCTPGVGDAFDLKVMRETEAQQVPDGFVVTVEEDQTILNVLKSDYPNPAKGDTVTVDGTAFNVIRSTDKYQVEWALTVREVVS